MKKLLAIFLCGVVMALFFVRPAFAEDVMTLYVKEGCPHCAKVEQYIQDNSLESHFNIRNVTTDSGADQEFTAFMEASNVPEMSQGVPFLVYDGTQWISGDQPIIDFVAQRYGLKAEDTKVSFSSSDYVTIIIGGLVVTFIIGYGIFNVINARKKS